MQEDIWEKEYQDPTLVTLSDVPAQCIRNFARFLRRERGMELSNLSILDLGCGNGKNGLYIEEQGVNNTVTGIEISSTALKYAQRLIPQAKLLKQSIGVSWPLADQSFDVILDVTSSNSLNEKERAVYLSEISRVLKPGGYLFVRALCKDGDKNAQNLLKTSSGKEKDTYIMPGLGLTERVFSREDLTITYSHFGEAMYIDKETHYTEFAGQKYKRNFWIGVWRKE